MMRHPYLILCLSLGAYPAVGRAQTAAEIDYLRARRDAVKRFDTLPPSAWNAAARNRQSMALSDLERRLRAIIGPVNVAGFPQPGKINLEALCTLETGCGVLDGLLYRTADWDRQLVVSTPGLVAGWIAGDGRTLPLDSIAEHLRALDMNGVLDSDAGATRYADLSIPDAARRGIIYAALVLRAQDYGPWPPNRVAVAVIRQNRVFVAQVTPVVPIDTLHACNAQLDSTFAAMKASGLTPQQMSGEGPFITYRACYAKHLSEIPGIDRIIRQVTTLVDALPPTAARNYGLTDHAALEGSWRVVDARARMSNEPAMIIDGLIDRGTVEFTGSTVTMRQLPHGDFVVHSFSLDTLGSPRRIRMIDSSAADGGRWTGLYKVSGDTLRLSLPISRDGSRPVPPASFNAPNTAAYILTRVPRNP